jgi:hypothetical protein
VSAVTRDHFHDKFSLDAIGVGFAFEKLFHGSIEVVSQVAVYPPMFFFGLTFIVIFIIVPGWRAFIVPMDEEHGYRFGFVPRIVVSRSQFELKMADTNIPEYRDACKEMINELSLILADLDRLSGEGIDEVPVLDAVPTSRGHHEPEPETSFGVELQIPDP